MKELSIPRSRLSGQVGAVVNVEALDYMLSGCRS